MGFLISNNNFPIHYNSYWNSLEAETLILLFFQNAWWSKQSHRLDFAANFDIVNHADENCPFIPGAEYSKSLFTWDPIFEWNFAKKAEK